MKVSIKNVAYGLLFLMALYFERLEAYLFLLLVFVELVQGIRNHSRITISAEMLFLSVCYVWYFFAASILTGSFGTYSIIRVLLGPVMGYLTGMLLTDSEDDVKKIIIIVAIGNIVYGVINLFMSPSITWVNRSVIDIWTGGYNAATLQSSFFTAAIGIALWLFRWNRFGKVCCITILGLSSYNAFMTSTRTTLYIVVISVMVGIYIQIFLSEEKDKRLKRVVLSLVVIAIAVIAFLVMFNRNVYGIRDLYEKSNLNTRVSYETANFGGGFSRSKRWMEGIQNILSHPGGMGNSFVQYAHNFWIDTGVSVGIIPFLSLIFYTVCIGLDLIKLNKCKEISSETKVLLTTTYIAYCMNFMVEPIFEAVPFMVITFFMINGAVKKILTAQTEEENNACAVVV